MTALPEPGHLLTIAEYAALAEDDRYRWELQEGNLVMSPRPTMRHMIASGELRDQLKTQLPAEWWVIRDLDVDLQLAPADQPGWSRRPDLLVVHKDAVARVDAEGGLLRAREVSLVIEIASPGSQRMDRVIKRGEYADAGIPYYWIIDLEPPVSLIAHHLAGEFGYGDDGEHTGAYAPREPWPLRIDLAALLP